MKLKIAEAPPFVISEGWEKNERKKNGPIAGARFKEANGR
jgi:hypothetical protein